MMASIKKGAQAFFKRVVPSVLVVTTAAACAPRVPVFMPVQENSGYNSGQPYQANRYVVTRSKRVGKDPYTGQKICDDTLYDGATGDYYSVRHGCNVPYDPSAVVGQYETYAAQTTRRNPAADVASFVVGVGLVALTVALLHPGHGRHHGRHYYYRHHR